MGKVKIKRKSTLIDMTAMSDVTVLLLTFFMLTSTFLQKEPATVITPSSVSEIKVPTSNLVTILVSGAGVVDGKRDASVEGKVFISIAGDVDSTFSSEKVRADVLRRAVSSYNDAHKNKPINLTTAEINKFAKMHMFGVRLDFLPEFLKMEQADQDEFMKNMNDPRIGIPVDGNRDMSKPNEFQIWMRAIQNVAQDNKDLGSDNFATALRKTGEGIAVKADKDTPYSTVHDILDNLQTLKLNKFSLMTALKTEEE